MVDTASQLGHGNGRRSPDAGDGGGAQSTGSGSWGTWETIAFTANYVVGTGFLTLPYAIVKSGTVLGTAALFFTLLLAIIAMQCTLEAVARAFPVRIMSEAGFFGATAVDEEARTAVTSGFSDADCRKGPNGVLERSHRSPERGDQEAKQARRDLVEALREGLREQRLEDDVQKAVYGALEERDEVEDDPYGKRCPPSGWRAPHGRVEMVELVGCVQRCVLPA